MWGRWSGVLAAALLVGCMAEKDDGEAQQSVDARPQDAADAGTGQERYTYPGCEPRTTYCPRDATFLCAMQALVGEHAQGCTQDSDCVAVTVPNNCAGYGSCEPLPVVRTTLRASFEAKVATEVQRYCGDAQCTQSGSCVPVITHPACAQGRCTARPGAADAGP